VRPGGDIARTQADDDIAGSRRFPDQPRQIARSTQRRDVAVTGVRFGGNAKAVVEGDTDGFVRLVSERQGGRLLGASLVGPHVTELVHELALAVQAGLTLGDVAATIHAHPTLSEAIGEAALNGLGRRIHSL
jgi:dihydrolipoamide dehydrogenase